MDIYVSIWRKEILVVYQKVLENMELFFLRKFEYFFAKYRSL